jgi:hypothetical protein
MVHCRALLLLGFRKTHEYILVALIGIHADEVFKVRPAGRTHLEVQVLYSPGKGKS